MKAVTPCTPDPVWFPYKLPLDTGQSVSMGGGGGGVPSTDNYYEFDKLEIQKSTDSTIIATFADSGPTLLFVFLLLLFFLLGGP